MKEEILLSIVVPCYNVEKYITECLESIIRLQNVINCQVICINDGSTDKTLSILETYRKIISNYIVINQDNQGLSVARNVGLNMAEGKWVFFVDSDDYIEKTGVIEILKDIQSSDIDIVCGEYYDLIDGVLNKKSENIPIIKNMSGIIFLNKFYFESALSMVWRYLYRRDFLLNNAVTFTPQIYFEDMDFTPKAFVKAEKIRYMPVPIYYYRQRHSSIMTSDFSTKKFNDSLYVATENLNLILTVPSVKSTMLKSAHYIIFRAMSIYDKPFAYIDYERYYRLVDAARRVRDKKLLAILSIYKVCPKLIKCTLSLVRFIKHY